MVSGSGHNKKSIGKAGVGGEIQDALWPLAKITINMDSSSQWVSRMCRFFFADEYARHTVGTPTASQVPDMESAFRAVQNALPKLETRIIEFLAEWLVSSGILSGILSGISSGIYSDISSGILSGILFGILSGISSGISSDILSDILSNFLLHILCPISSYMRSGREHLAWILAVEVRQGTLGVGTRG